MSRYFFVFLTLFLRYQNIALYLMYKYVLCGQYYLQADGHHFSFEMTAVGARARVFMGLLLLIYAWTFVLHYFSLLTGCIYDNYFYQDYDPLYSGAFFYTGRREERAFVY